MKMVQRRMTRHNLEIPSWREFNGECGYGYQASTLLYM